MWTIIKRVDDSTYDIVPNSWLVNNNTCCYPDVGLSRTKAYAVRCQVPDSTWDQVTVEILERDIDNYERGMTNVIRFTKGKRSVTSSEEERANSKRKKIKKHRDSDDREQEEIYPLSYNEPVVKPIQSPPFTFEPDPVSPCRPSTLFSTQLPTTTQSPSICKPGVQCKIRANRKHYCVFQSKREVDLEAIGHALCVITRKLEVQQNNLNILSQDVKEIQTLLEKNSDHRQILSEEESSTTEVWREFPLKSIAEVEALEEKLKSKDFIQACIGQLSAAAEKTSEARTVTSIMSKVLSLEAAMYYTWKGVTRKDHKVAKKAFKNLALANVVIAATKRCWPGVDRSRVETAASTWIAQAKAKSDRLLAKSSINEEATN